MLLALNVLVRHNLSATYRCADPIKIFDGVVDPTKLPYGLFAYWNAEVYLQ